jgi:hypothetical protein
MAAFWATPGVEDEELEEVDVFEDELFELELPQAATAAARPSTTSGSPKRFIIRSEPSPNDASMTADHNALIPFSSNRRSRLPAARQLGASVSVTNVRKPRGIAPSLSSPTKATLTLS